MTGSFRNYINFSFNLSNLRKPLKATEISCQYSSTGKSSSLSFHTELLCISMHYRAVLERSGPHFRLSNLTLFLCSCIL